MAALCDPLLETTSGRSEGDDKLLKVYFVFPGARSPTSDEIEWGRVENGSATPKHLNTE